MNDKNGLWRPCRGGRDVFRCLHAPREPRPSMHSRGKTEFPPTPDVQVDQHQKPLYSEFTPRRPRPAPTVSVLAPPHEPPWTHTGGPNIGAKESQNRIGLAPLGKSLRGENTAGGHIGIPHIKRAREVVFTIKPIKTHPCSHKIPPSSRPIPLLLPTSSLSRAMVFPGKFSTGCGLCRSRKVKVPPHPVRFSAGGTVFTSDD